MGIHGDSWTRAHRKPPPKGHVVTTNQTPHFGLFPYKSCLALFIEEENFTYYQSDRKQLIRDNRKFFELLPFSQTLLSR